MSARKRGRAAVLGMGNTLYSDDGTGIAALRILEKTGAGPAETTLIDGSVVGLEAAALIAESDRLIILDAVDAGAAPGTLIRMEGDALKGLTGGASVHRLGIADLLSALAMMGRMPVDVVLLGIQPASIELGVELTPSVARAVGDLVSTCRRQIADWNISRG